jgi:hypothetical protein
MQARDGAIALGFGGSATEARGLKIDPQSGTAMNVFSSQSSAPILLVSPLSQNEEFFVATEDAPALVPLTGSTRFLAVDGKSIGVSDGPEGEMVRHWQIDSDLTTTPQVVSAGDGYIFTFRSANGIHGACIGKDGGARCPLATIVSGSDKVGRPRTASNGEDVITVYATTNGAAPWRLAVARASGGTVPRSPTDLPLPLNGPGGDAIAPDIVGLSGGRWLIMWTEGASGARALRAQTYDRLLQPVGDPIALSPVGGSFGQAAMGVVGAHVVVAFLGVDADADEGIFQLWGGILGCG